MSKLSVHLKPLRKALAACCIWQIPLLLNIPSQVKGVYFDPFWIAAKFSPWIKRDQRSWVKIPKIINVLNQAWWSFLAITKQDYASFDEISCFRTWLNLNLYKLISGDNYELSISLSSSLSPRWDSDMQQNKSMDSQPIIEFLGIFTGSISIRLTLSSAVHYINLAQNPISIFEASL